MKIGYKTLFMSLILAGVMLSGCSTAPSQTDTPQTAERVEAKTSDDTENETPDKPDSDPEKDEAQKYMNALKDAFHEYVSPTHSFTEEIEAKNFENAEKALDEMESALKKIESVSAPSKYADLQARLNSTISIEYDYVKLCRKFLGYCKKGDDLTEDDKTEVKAINEELALTSSGFADAFLETVKTVSADLK